MPFLLTLQLRAALVQQKETLRAFDKHIYHITECFTMHANTLPL